MNAPQKDEDAMLYMLSTARQTNPEINYSLEAHQNGASFLAAKRSTETERAFDVVKNLKQSGADHIYLVLYDSKASNAPGRRTLLWSRAGATPPPSPPSFNIQLSGVEPIRPNIDPNEFVPATSMAQAMEELRTRMQLESALQMKQWELSRALDENARLKERADRLRSLHNSAKRRLESAITEEAHLRRELEEARRPGIVDKLVTNLSAPEAAPVRAMGSHVLGNLIGRFMGVPAAAPDMAASAAIAASPLAGNSQEEDGPAVCEEADRFDDLVAIMGTEWAARMMGVIEAAATRPALLVEFDRAIAGRVVVRDARPSAPAPAMHGIADDPDEDLPEDEDFPEDEDENGERDYD